jgi:hypothetical protein
MITADIAAHLEAPEFTRFRLPAAALAAIAEKLGRARALEFARDSEDVTTKAGGLMLVNTKRALALMKDEVNAPSEDEHRRVKKRLDRALSEEWLSAGLAAGD